MDILYWICVYILVHIFLLLYCRFGSHMKIKMGIYYWLCSSLSIVFIVPMLFSWKSTKNYRYPMGTLRLLVSSFGLDITVKGQELLQKDEPYVIVVNHQSSIDMFGVSQIWPEKCTILAKKELRWAGPFGLMAQLCDCIFIDRLNHKKASNTMKSIADLIRNNKMKVMVFPEGTRHIGATLLPFKKGAFNVAVEAQIPIIPIVISSYRSFYKPDEGLFENGKVTVSVLPEISTSGLTLDDVPALADRTRDIMLEAFQEK